jgi:hypothetical protein
MSVHWKVHIGMGLIIAFLFGCGIYLLGVAAGLQEALEKSSQRYADLQSKAIGALVQVNATAAEVQRAHERNEKFAENLTRNLAIGADPEAHALVRDKKKRRKAKRQKRRRAKIDTSMGGP